MMKPGRFTLLLLLAVSLSACDLPLGQDLPTPYPQSYLPTVIALTAAAAQPSATLDAAATAPGVEAGTAPTDIPPTLTPRRTPIPTATATFTPTPTPPPADVQFTQPGPMSKVASPLRLRGFVMPGAQNLVNVELYGEDGRLVAQKLTRLYGGTAEHGAYISLDLPFKIPTVSELARLQITTADEYGRPAAISSVHLLLLSAGVSQITPPGSQERCHIFAPLPKSTASGGVLEVHGEFQPFNDQPVVLDLLDDTGKILDTRVLPVNGLEMQSFSVSLSYQVSAPVEARLVLSQADSRIPGPFYLYSREVTIRP